MSDSAQATTPPTRTAQPFLYAPATGEGARIFHGTAESTRTVGRGNGAESSNVAQDAQKAYEKGLAEGDARVRTEFEKALAEARSQVSGALRKFSSDRSDYFEKVETEIVRLSLSIARKILHRESQIDPLLLMGVVHVALQKLDGSTRVRLRTNPEEARFWNDYFKQSKDIHPSVDVVGDPSLAQGHCTLETDLGSTQISLDTQLREIEQGFLDLLEQRPRGEE